MMSVRSTLLYSGLFYLTLWVPSHRTQQPEEGDQFLYIKAAQTCGDTITGVGGVIELPYGVTSTQSSQVHCTWIIKAPKDHVILFYAESFNIPKERFTENCQDASLRFYNKKTKYSSVLPSACGNTMQPTFLPTNVVSIEYIEKTTDFQLQRYSQFTVVWTAYLPKAMCLSPSTLGSLSTVGFLTSPNSAGSGEGQVSVGLTQQQLDESVKVNSMGSNVKGNTMRVRDGYFICETSKICISKQLLCDGHANCGFDTFGNLDTSDEKCDRKLGVGAMGGRWVSNFWTKNWNVILSVVAVLSVTSFIIISYYLRHQSMLRSSLRRRIEAMQKTERHFDDPLPPVPNSEMGTQSSLNLAMATTANASVCTGNGMKQMTQPNCNSNDYSPLPPYEVINDGHQFVAHFGPPDMIMNSDATGVGVGGIDGVMMSAPVNSSANHNNKSSKDNNSKGSGSQGHFSFWGGAGRKSQSGASSRGSSSPLSSRSASAARQFPLSHQHARVGAMGNTNTNNNNNKNNGHPTRSVISGDSNDSDSVFSGSERGSNVSGSASNACKRKHRRECLNKKYTRNSGSANNASDISGNRGRGHSSTAGEQNNREWEMMQIPHPSMFAQQNAQNNTSNPNSSAKPCTCRGKMSPLSASFMATTAAGNFNNPQCPETPIMSPPPGASNLMYLGKDINSNQNGGSITCYNFPGDTPVHVVPNSNQFNPGDLGPNAAAAANRTWRSQDFLDQLGYENHQMTCAAAAASNCRQTNTNQNGGFFARAFPLTQGGGGIMQCGPVSFTSNFSFSSNKGWKQAQQGSSRRHDGCNQGYHSETDNYRGPIAATRGRPVMGGSRGYKSETEDGGMAGASSRHFNGGGGVTKMTAAQKAFALLRKQQQHEQEKQEMRMHHQFNQVNL